MKKAAIAFACILLLTTTVSCTHTVYDAKTEEALELYDEGEIMSAIKTLSEAIEIDDFAYEAYAMRGCLFRQIKKYELAISDFESAIERGGEYYNYPLAKLLIDVGKPQAAEEYLLAYIQYDDCEPEAYIILANIYRQRGDNEAACEIREKGYGKTGDKRLEKHR